MTFMDSLCKKLVLLLLLALCASVSHAQTSPRHAGIANKLIVGYQGWFGCPQDFEGNPHWQHWFLGPLDVRNLTVDMLPDVRAYDPADLCDTGIPKPDGTTVKVFSSQNRNVVDAHFKLMSQYGIDIAALQRFVQATVVPEKLRRIDHVLDHVRRSSAQHGVKYMVTYDVSGADTQQVIELIRRDWRRLSRELAIVGDRSYLRVDGKPALQLWGFGFSDRPGDPDSVLQLINDLRRGEGGFDKTYVIGGVPSSWRTLTGDARPEAGWASVYRAYDALSPWLVGRFSDNEEMARLAQSTIRADLTELAQSPTLYIPVVFPGFSWFNMMTVKKFENKAIFNQIPRSCGKFLWNQVYSHLKLGVRSLYLAMFDEFDEGTAIHPSEPRMDKLPIGSNLLFLNQDGCSLPADWYLHLANRAGESLRKNTPPASALLPN